MTDGMYMSRMNETMSSAETLTVNIRKKRGIAKKIITIAAFITLAGAYIFGLINRGYDIQNRLAGYYPPGTMIGKIQDNPVIYRIAAGEKTIAYVSVATARGWGGPLTCATEISPEGAVIRVLPLNHMETPSFFTRVIKNDFLRQFEGKSVTAPLTIGNDIDAVTRATFTSAAITETVRTGAHGIGAGVFHLDIRDTRKEWEFGVKEAVLLVLYSIILIGLLKKIPKLRYATMAAGLVFLGFYLNSPISVSHFSALLLGYFPPLAAHLFWWFLVAGTLVFTLLYGRNIYCYWLCPFGALQEFSSRLSGINLKLSPRVLGAAKYTTLGLLWLALVIIFLTGNPSMGAYEPFGTLFALEGSGVQWILLPVIVFAAFFIRRFWCRFFCPAGAVLNLSVKLHRRVEALKERKKDE